MAPVLVAQVGGTCVSVGATGAPGASSINTVDAGTELQPAAFCSLTVWVLPGSKPNYIRQQDKDRKGPLSKLYDEPAFATECDSTCIGFAQELEQLA